MKYTPKQLDEMALADLLNDARCAAEQSENGPYYPESGLTKETLLAYSRKCYARADLYRNGGAHIAVLEGRA
jgi:hypothetical protein